MPIKNGRVDSCYRNVVRKEWNRSNSFTKDGAALQERYYFELQCVFRI